VLEREYPTVTIRLQNVTAINVMESLLNVNGLRLETDPSTGILRINI